MQRVFAIFCLLCLSSFAQAQLNPNIPIFPETGAIIWGNNVYQVRKVTPFLNVFPNPWYTSHKLTNEYHWNQFQSDPDLNLDEHDLYDVSGTLPSSTPVNPVVFEITKCYKGTLLEKYPPTIVPDGPVQYRMNFAPYSFNANQLVIANPSYFVFDLSAGRDWKVTGTAKILSQELGIATVTGVTRFELWQSHSSYLYEVISTTPLIPHQDPNNPPYFNPQQPD